MLLGTHYYSGKTSRIPMNNIHNPCVKTFRAFHSKLFARTFSTLLPNQVCLHQEKPPPSRRMIREQCFHSVRPHNGTDLNKGLHWNRLAFTNQVAGCFLRGKEDKASFITTCDCREKIADKTGEANHDGNPDQHNRKHDTFSTVNQISNKIEQTNVTNKINRPENPDRERNRSKAIFASAHEEFREIQRKNATQSVPGDKVYSVLNRKGFNDDEEDGQNSHNQDDDGDSNSLGLKGRKVKVGMQYETELAFSYDNLLSFGKLSRDWNPIHYYPDDGRVQHLSRIYRIQSVEEIEAKKTLQEDNNTEEHHSHDGYNLTEDSDSATVVKDPQMTEGSHPEDSTEDEALPRVPILPGALLNNLISGIIGTKLPGPGTLILHQTLNYKNMAFVEEKIRIRVRVTAVRKMLVSASYKVWTYRNDERVIILTGDARLVCRT